MPPGPITGPGGGSMPLPMRFKGPGMGRPPLLAPGNSPGGPEW